MQTERTGRADTGPATLHIHVQPRVLQGPFTVPLCAGGEEHDKGDPCALQKPHLSLLAEVLVICTSEWSQILLGMSRVYKQTNEINKGMNEREMDAASCLL